MLDFFFGESAIKNLPMLSQQQGSASLLYDDTANQHAYLHSKSDEANVPISLTAMVSFQHCFCLQHTYVVLQTQAMPR